MQGMAFLGKILCPGSGRLYAHYAHPQHWQIKKVLSVLSVVLLGDVVFVFFCVVLTLELLSYKSVYQY